MNLNRACEIIRSLADGRDPSMRLCPKATATRAGRQFPRDGPYELATAYGRMVGAITAHLVKFGIIEENPINRAGQGSRPPERNGFWRPQSDAPAPGGGSDADPLPI